MLLVAVADGAGSARRAEEGSRRAVEASTTYVAARIEKALPETEGEVQSLLMSALDAARMALVELAGDEPLAELSTTLLLTLVTRSWLSSVQVGDGAVVCRERSGTFDVLSVPGDDEYLNETTFLTSPNALSATHCVTIPSSDITGVAVLSDGLTLLALRYSDNTAHAPFFEHMFSFAEQPDASEIELREFLGSERVCERTDDDKTLVLAVRNDTP